MPPATPFCVAVASGVVTSVWNCGSAACTIAVRVLMLDHEQPFGGSSQL